MYKSSLSTFLIISQNKFSLSLSPQQGTNLSNNIYQKTVFSETDVECISSKSVQKKIKVHC